jgi:hypothetical protein
VSAEKPIIKVLKAITPKPESARAERLEYGNLSDVVDEHRPFEHHRNDEFWQAEADSLSELELAKDLAKYYMLLGSQALQGSETESSRTLWSDRYTLASSEIYGEPDPKIAQRLWEQQGTGGEVVMDENVAKAAEALKEHLVTKYAAAFDVLKKDLGTEPLEPTEIADRFEAAMQVLGTDYDEAWGEWRIDRSEEKDSLSVVGSEKKIIVGMHRANMAPDQLEALFSHEVLVHALRVVNGSKVSDKLGEGLPGYLDAEEGLGVFVEFALNGTVSQKNVDRYVDIAYALGQIDGKQHTRAEVLEHVRARAMKRNESSVLKQSQEDMEKEMYAHVNRIFRGSLGNEHIGIYTKDIAYYKGFIDMANYIAEQLEEGKAIDEVMDYLLVGKFDPRNQAHIDYLEATAKAA